MEHIREVSHVGGFIRRQIVEPYGLSVTAAAKSLGVGRVALSNLLNEKQGLSPEMALRIEAAFGVKADTLLKMHHTWELTNARRREAEILERIPRVPAAV